ncbi:MAG: hypothetical protein ACLFMO_02230 [Eubacteriales bacterium]
MRKVILVFLVIFLVGCGNQEKVNERRPLESIDDLEIVDSNHMDVSNLTIKEVDVVDETSEGGVIRGFYNEGTLIKLNTVYFGTIGKVEYDVYLYHNIWMVRVTEYNYSAPIGNGDTMISSSLTKEFVIENDDTYYVHNEVLKPYNNDSIYKIIKGMIASLDNN